MLYIRKMITILSNYINFTITNNKENVKLLSIIILKEILYNIISLR